MPPLGSRCRAQTATLIADEPDETQVLVLCVICFAVLTGPIIGIQMARKAISDANENLGGGYDMSASAAERNKIRDFDKKKRR